MPTNERNGSLIDTSPKQDGENARDRKRRRGAHACDVCRSRKVRCDGEQPCQNCVTAEVDCTYGAEGLVKGKTDQILEGVQRVEASLIELKGMMATQSSSVLASGSPRPLSGRRTTITTLSTGHDSEGVVSKQPRDEDRWTNAVLSAQHISSTESLLQWDCFNALPELRRGKQPVFMLEQQRPPLIQLTIDIPPLIDTLEITQILNEFRSTVNFAYPVLGIKELEDVKSYFVPGSRLTNPSIGRCRALLVMALGCASRAVDLVSDENAIVKACLRARKLAASYFSLFQQQSYLIHDGATVITTQCLLFIALYYAYLQRPLQAWSYINLTATRCRLLLSYDTEAHSTNKECLRRIFWSCFILESDYLAELAALPQSGIGDIESTVPLPAEYATSNDISEQELSSLYFLACISMRRLLNRVHDLLYAPRTGVGLDDSRFPQLVRELDHQLEQWRAYLPTALSFNIDTLPTTNPHGGFLRQRYLTCRSVIYRPFLTRALRDECEEYTLLQSMVCLEACILHIANLRPYKHTVLVDTWICSLSMASAMLVLLAAYQRPQLRGGGLRANGQISGLGAHLVALIEAWMTLPGDSDEEVSPSVRQSLRIIRETDMYIEEFAGG